LTKSQTFIFEWPEVGHIRAKQGQNREKTLFSRAEEWYFIVVFKRRE